MKHMRKIIALMMTMLMLCTLMPVSAAVEGNVAYDGYIYNGDFEAGEDHWTMVNSSIIATEVVEDPTNSGHGKVMKTDANNTSDGGTGNEMFSQSVQGLIPHSNYVLKFKVYVYSDASTNPGFWVTLGTNDITYKTSDVTTGPMEVKTVDSSTSTRVRFTAVQSSSRKTWIEVKIPFYSDIVTNTTFTFSNYRSYAGQYYFDDVTLEYVNTPEPETPDTPVEEAKLDVDFESGVLPEGWSLTTAGTSAVTAAAAANGSKYGMHINGEAWAEVLTSKAFGILDGAYYVISFQAKALADGAKLSLQVKNPSNPATPGNGSNIFDTSVALTTEWKTYTYTVSKGDAQTSYYASVMFASLGKEVYLDNVQVFEDIPLNPDANEGNLLQNGSFDDRTITGWDNLYGNCTISFDAGKDSAAAVKIQANQWNMMRQKVTVEQDTDYVLSAWAKSSTAFSLLVKDGRDTKNMAQKSLGAGSAWTYIEVTFNSEEQTSVYVALMSSSDNGSAIVDDVKLVKIPKEEPAPDVNYDNLMQNGDFETGTLDGWNKHQNTRIASTAAYGGTKYGVRMMGPGSWDGVLDQKVAVDKGKTYHLSFWYRPVTNGLNFAVLTDSNEKLASFYFSSSNTKSWTKYEVTFESAYNTSITLNFSGSGKNSTDEVWLDEVVLANLSGAEMDREEVLAFNGAAIRDTVEQNRGLAFQFHLDAAGTQMGENQQWVSGTGNIKLFKYSTEVGMLVEAGALLSNREEMADQDMTFDDVDGKKTIKVPVKYLTQQDSDSIDFAVRVIDIPDYAEDAPIYARPYYTYIIGGKTYTVYGDTVADNYAHVAANRRIMRVLTVGTDYAAAAADTHLYDVLKAADYDQVILGNLVYTGAGAKSYRYVKNNDNGQWVEDSVFDLRTALRDERWDYVVIALPNAQADDMPAFVKEINDNKVSNTTKVMWQMAWGEDQAQAVATAKKVAAIDGVDGVLPTATALNNLSTLKMEGIYADGLYLSDTYGDYALALTWYVTLSGGECLDEMDYIPEAIVDHYYDAARAAAHAYITPYEVQDLNETLILASSDFQPNTIDKGLQNIHAVMGSLNKAGYYGFDGLLFTGDYTQAHGSDHDMGTEGQAALNQEVQQYIKLNRIYGQGNHDAGTIEALNPYGNNDPFGATYGVFNIPEDKYDAYGNGGKQVGQDLTAYFNEKLASDWGNKPIFVISHLPLHYNYRTIKDKGASSAMYIVNALNAASDAGLNIIFLFGHNHSGGYDDYLGGAAIYVPKGDSMLVCDPNGYKNAPINTELRFTYMNSGYIGYYNDMEMGADCTLTMSLFRIQADGSVIITRYSSKGEHNLKSAGKLSPDDRKYTTYTEADGRVYTSSRIVSAGVDKEYEE